MEWTPWGPADLKETVTYRSCHVPKTEEEEEDGAYIWWRATVLVHCRGWGYPCANSVLIRHGGTMCSVCARKFADASAEEQSSLVDLWEKYRGAEDACFKEPPDDNELLQEGGEWISGTDAVDAAKEVARVLAANGERGFEILFTPEVADKHRYRRNFFDILGKALCRLAYIADTKVLPWETTKAASVLGGVRACPPIIPGKAGRPRIGHVSDNAEASFLHRLFDEKAKNGEQLSRCCRRGQEDQIRALMSSQYDDNDIKTVCNAALAAACVAHIKEKNHLCSLEPGCLKWHHFAGGCWATGNFPTCQ